MCFKVIKPRIISYHVRDHLYSGPPCSFFFLYLHFNPFFLWAFFHLTFLLFFLIFSLDVCISCESKFLFRTRTFHNMPFENMHLHDPSWPLEFHFSTLALQCGRWSLVGVQKENHQAQKGRLLDNFLYQWRDDERWLFFISNIVT